MLFGNIKRLYVFFLFRLHFARQKLNGIFQAFGFKFIVINLTVNALTGLPFNYDFRFFCILRLNLVGFFCFFYGRFCFGFREFFVRGGLLLGNSVSLSVKLLKLLSSVGQLKQTLDILMRPVFRIGFSAVFLFYFFNQLHELFVC